MAFVDSFGRAHDDLRVSVTDRCNLRCAYCMPEEPVWFPRGEILATRRFSASCGSRSEVGVRKVRITGGEPLLRRDLSDADRHTGRRFRDRGPLADDQRAAAGRTSPGTWPRAGLRRVNVSLDSIVPERFERLTRRPLLEKVLAGLCRRRRWPDWRRSRSTPSSCAGSTRTRSRPSFPAPASEGWEVRFIEFMPLENGETWDLGQRRDVARRSGAGSTRSGRWRPSRRPICDAPANRFRFRDGRGPSGFINSVSEPFCATAAGCA